jgi:hypothetical protein
MWECKAKSIEAAAETGDPNVKISKVSKVKNRQFLINKFSRPSRNLAKGFLNRVPVQIIQQTLLHQD